MPDTTFTQFAVVNSGQTISTVVEIDRARVGGIFVPNSETSQVFLQVSWDTASANFARVRQTGVNTNFWSVSSATTRVAKAFAGVAAPFQYARIETGSATTDTRTFVFSAKI